ncbi:MAG TPA: prenyltransferase [Bacteroidetes bacterium]|nr:prenyltransferase [Bacteroidota bacterium]
MMMEKQDKKSVSLAAWMAQVRGPFLILAILLVAIGLAFAYKMTGPAEKEFNLWHALMLLTGVVSAHISVNLFNEYSDHKTRIDSHTKRTPFSGGSGMMQQGLTTPRQVLTVAVTTLLLAFSIGVYFTFTSHWFIMVLTLIGGVTIISYTEGLARIQLGELFAGLALGSLVVIGTYVAMTATPGMPLSGIIPLKVILVSVPPGILTALLLLINEFPDMEADKAGGRRHLVIVLGRKKAAYLYAFGMFLTFGTILILPLVGLASAWIYLALIPMPLGIRSSITAIRHGDDIPKMVPALGTNVITVLGTDLLLAVGIIIPPGF